jgi:hypothetical protein
MNSNAVHSNRTMNFTDTHSRQDLIAVLKIWFQAALSNSMKIKYVQHYRCTDMSFDQIVCEEMRTKFNSDLVTPFKANRMLFIRF